MNRLTNRDKEIPLVCSANDRFWANVHEKLARYEDAEEQGTLFPRWIPVTERLPSIGHNVLVFYAGEAHAAYLTNCTSSGCLCWVEGYGNYIEVSDNKIKFWMPLPEPPKEET